MFELNQELTVRSDLNELDHIEFDLVDEMYDYRGMKAKVTNLFDEKNDSCCIDLDDGIWTWYTWCFEETK